MPVDNIAQAIARALRKSRTEAERIASEISRAKLWIGDKPLTLRQQRELAAWLNDQLDAKMGAPKTPLRKAIVNQLIEATDKATATLSATQPDRFGSTFATRYSKAVERLKMQVRKELADGIRKERTMQEVRQAVVARLASHTPIRAVVAYDMARVINVEQVENFKLEGVEQVKIRIVRNSHNTDICDTFLRIYAISEVILPPYHPYCRCRVVKA